MLKVTLLTKDMREQYMDLYNAHLQALSKMSRPAYDNTLVLLDGAGKIMSAVTFSYSKKKRQFTELHTLTQPDLRRRGYSKLLLNAFAKVVSRIPEFKGAYTCMVRCGVDNEAGIKYHEATANYIGIRREDYGSGKKDYAEFSQNIKVWLNYDIPFEYEIDDVVKEKFLARVMWLKIR